MTTFKCTGCKERFENPPAFSTPIGNFHEYSCVIDHANRSTERRQAKAQRKEKSDNKLHRKHIAAEKERIRRRTGKGGYYAALKSAQHYYVKHVLRKGESCYTCGKEQRHEDAGGAFHVGHFIPAGEVDPRRFMAENQRIQCFTCNSPKSGMRVEYRAAMIEEMGLKHVEWLERDVNHKSLKEQYPDSDSLKSEIKRYRALGRQARTMNDN